MGAYTMSATIAPPYEEALPATRTALSAQGYGILTEIDLADTMTGLADDGAPDSVAANAKQRLTAALAALSKEE